MGYIVPSINPIDALGGSSGMPKVKTKKDVEKAFVSMVMSQIMKDMVKAPGSLLGGESAFGTVTDNMYKEIMMTKLTNDMVESKAFGFDKMMAGENK
jgi:hypothetical protein